MNLDNLIDFINEEKEVDLRVRGSKGKKRFYIRCYFLIANKFFIKKTHKEIANKINRDHATSIYHKDKMIDLISIYKADRDEFNELEHKFLEEYPKLREISKVYADNCNYSTLEMSRKVVKLELKLKTLERNYRQAKRSERNEKRKVASRDRKIVEFKNKGGFISQLTRSLTSAKQTIEKTVATNKNLRHRMYYWRNKCMRLENIEVKLEKVS